MVIDMKNEENIIKLKKEIEKKRERLNQIVISESSKDEILKFSQELDVLISMYTRHINTEIKSSR